MVKPQSTHSYSYARKRSLAVVGMLLPTMAFVQATPFVQHRVRQTARAVPYQTSRIPSDLAISRSSMESRTESSQKELFWYIHADAVNEHPDQVFEEIRRYGYTKRFQEAPIRRDPLAASSLLRGGMQRRTTSNAFADVNGAVADPEISIVAGDTNETTADTVGFNVSVETEYDVEFVGNDTSTANDSSTVIYTSSDKETSNSTSNSSDGDSPLNSNATITPENNETSSSASFRPLRMRAFLSELAGGGQHLKPVQRSLLLESIIKPALLAWSAALRVEPVVGNLTVDPHQLVDGISCGPGGDLPSVVIPVEHITVGVADTDFIVYISLAFCLNCMSDSGMVTKHNSTIIEGFGNLNNGTLDGNPRGNTTNTTAANITDNDNPKEPCSGDYLAASAFCSTDQFDRPTAAILHLCIGENFFASENVPTNIMIVLHELGHALGFNAVSLAHFRRPNGTAYTERDPNTGEIPITEIECTGPVGQRQTANVTLPSEDILQFRTVRGGVRVAEVVTPSVRQVARNHFDCQELPGAELESGEFLPLSTNPGKVSCLGDHWERRLFKTDLMNPLVDDNLEFNPRFSTITLAYFADSGWYQVDLSRATFAAGWGRAAGCDFVEETCIQADDGQVPSKFSSFFCNQAPADGSGYTSDIHGCTIDLSRKASCSLDSYEGELPPAYQYFNFMYGANVGGTDPFMDYCPVFAGFANGLCSDSENEALIKVNLIERIGQRNSRCLTGQVSRASSNAGKSGSTSSGVESASAVTEATALCLPIACVVEDRSLRIQVDGVWKLCRKKDDIIELGESSSFTSNTASSITVVNVVCPDPIRICPTFYCNRDCLGSNRICDYTVGKCVCNSTKVADDYKSWKATSFTAVDKDICVVPNASESTGSFFIPEIEDDNGLPTADSPLADYYVPAERDLNETEGEGVWMNRWKGILSGSISFALLVVAVVWCMIIRWRRPSGQIDGDGDAPTGGDEWNPDKHKLMASVVVNLRMNDPNLQRRADELGDRGSETDLSMTDTEGTNDVPSEEYTLTPPTSDQISGTVAELSGRENDIVSRLGFDDEDEYIDPLAPPSSTAPVVRRRHIFSNTFN